MFNSKWKKLILSLIAVLTLVILFIVGYYVVFTQQVERVTEPAEPAEPVVALEAEPVEEAPIPPADGKREQGWPVSGTYAMRDMVVTEGIPVSPRGVDRMDRKIIKSAYMALDTIEFERTTDAIVGKAVAMGGYIESSSVQGTRLADKGHPSRRIANFHIRIPKEQFEAFMSAVGELGVVTIEQIMGQDITGQYFDTETRVRTLKVQEERLLSLLAKADKLTDILEIERELSRVRFDIENLTGTLKGWDHMIEYSLISIDVYEVEELKEVEPKPETWSDRIAKAFRNSLKNLALLFENLTIFLVAAIPYLAILAVIGWGAWKAWKALRKKALTDKTKGGTE